MTRRSMWHVTIMSRDGQRIVHHAQCEDIKEVQGVCTIARDHSYKCHNGYQIWINPPAGEVYAWD